MMRWICIFLWLAVPAIAEIQRPTSLDDTLRVLAEAFQKTGRFDDVRIDLEDKSVSLKTRDEWSRRSYPDNLHREMLNAETDAERQNLLDSHVASIVETTFTDASGEADRANVLPVIRHKSIGDAYAGQKLVSAPFAGDLRIYYVVDRPNTLSYVSDTILEDMALERSAVSELAARNFKARDWQPEFKGEDIWLLVFDGNFEASFLLDTALWQDIDNQLDTIVMVALARDVVLFTDAGIEGAEAELRRLADENFDQMSYQLSPEIFVWSDDGWRPR